MRSAIRVVAALLCACSCASAGQLTPPAGPVAPTMKDLPDVEPRQIIRNAPGLAAPVVISRSGSYYLGESITGIGNEHGIEITASHVTLDLNGFEVVGSEIGSLEGILVGESLTDVAIVNGTVRGFMDGGITATDTTGVSVVGVSAISNGAGGISVGPGSRIEACLSSANGFDGIRTGRGSTVIGCASNLNQAIGVSIGQSSSIADTVASENGADGIVIGAFSAATNCASALNGGRGFRLISGSTIVGCSATQNTLRGFEVQSFSSGVTIVECTARQNSDTGFLLRDLCYIYGCNSQSNTNDGILAVGLKNRIDSNACTDNTDDGIDINECANLCVRNSLADNGDAPIEAIACFVGPNLLGALSTSPASAGPWDNFDHSGP